MALSSSSTITGSEGSNPSDPLLAPELRSYIFPAFDLVEWDWLKTLCEDSIYPPLKKPIEKWLREHRIEYVLDMGPVWASSRSTITIQGLDHAMLFKLTWL